MTTFELREKLETRARNLLSVAVGVPCLHATLGDLILVTEWQSEADALKAAVWFQERGRQGVRISHDRDLGWNVECEDAK